MADLWAWLALGGPLLAAVAMLLAALFRVRLEEVDAWRLAVAGVGLGALGQGRLFIGALTGSDRVALGRWWAAGGVEARLDLAFDAWTAGWALATSLIGLGVLAFSRAYLHREPAFVRAMGWMSALLGGVGLLALAADGLIGFVGWELAGTASVMLIGFYPERPAAARASLRAFATNRVADAAFLLGLLGLAAYAGSFAFVAAGVPTWIGFAFAIAGLAKAAQVPFSPWLERAIEGPTPTTALFYGGAMVHAGALLLARAEGVLGWEARAFLAIFAGISLIYGLLAAAAQHDVKRALVLHTLASASVVILIVAAGAPGPALGVSALAMAAQTTRLLLGPSWLATRGSLPHLSRVPGFLAGDVRLRAAAERRFDLEARVDALVVPFIDVAARAADRVEARLIEPIAGSELGAAPVAARPVTPADLDDTSDAEAQEGLLARATAAAADAVHRAEDRVVAGWVGEALPQQSSRFGLLLERFESVLQRPWVPAVVVAGTLLAVLGGVL